MYTLDMVSKRSEYNSFQYVTPKCIVYNGFWTFSALQKHKENKGISAFGGSTCHPISAIFWTIANNILHNIIFHGLPGHPKDSAQEPAQAQNSIQSW